MAHPCSALSGSPLRGFGGPRTGHAEQDLAAIRGPGSGSTADVLRLPADAIAYGPHLVLPDLLAEEPGPRQYDAIVLDHLAPGLGDPVTLLAELGRRLRPDGTLYLQIANVTAPQRLRRLIEPRTRVPRAGDATAESALDALTLLDAVRDAGLCTRDLIPVPATTRLPARLGDALADLGLDSAGWIGPPPPAHWLLIAEPGERLAGSVIRLHASEREGHSIEPNEPGDAADGWELLDAPANDLAAIDRAIAQSRGEVLLFAPAGAELGEADFRAARACWLDRPCRLAEDTGSLHGLAISRDDALRAGPLTQARFPSVELRIDDWFLRLSRLGLKPRPAPDGARAWTRSATPRADRTATPACQEISTRRFTHRWQQHAAPATDTAAASRAPRLSLCMIVRNEADVIEQSLERAASWCDEILVVDTGSTDDTAGRAAAAGARVLHEPWCDDFAAARNASLRAATGDWCLILDADEFVDPADAPRIRAALDRPDVLAWSLRMRSRRVDSSSSGDVWLTRLFRRLPGVQFERRIHEQVVPSLERVAARGDGPAELGVLDVVIDHVGYLPDRYAKHGKRDRNLRLLDLQLRETPGDAYTWFQLAEQLIADDGRIADPSRFATAIETAGKLLEGLPSHRRRLLPFAAEVAGWQARACLDEGAVDAAAAVLDRALGDVTPTPNLLHLAGLVALLEDRPATAARHLRACLEQARGPSTVRRIDGVGGAETWLSLGEAERDLGNVHAARLAWQRAMQIAPPGDETGALAATNLALQTGDVRAAVRALSDHLRATALSPQSTPSPRCQALLVGLQAGLTADRTVATR